MTREDDLREGFPVPHNNVLKSINSFAPCCECYFYFLLIEAPTHVTRTDQSGRALKIAYKIKIDCKKLSLKETNAWVNPSLRSSSLDMTIIRIDLYHTATITKPTIDLH